MTYYTYKATFPMINVLGMLEHWKYTEILSKFTFATDFEFLRCSIEQIPTEQAKNSLFWSY